MGTAHIDTFARDNLPPRAQWPELIFDLPELRYPGRLNCATELLDRAPERGWARRVALRFPEGELSYAQLLEQLRAGEQTQPEAQGAVVAGPRARFAVGAARPGPAGRFRSEEHTSELQSQ